MTAVNPSACRSVLIQLLTQPTVTPLGQQGLLVSSSTSPNQDWLYSPERAKTKTYSTHQSKPKPRLTHSPEGAKTRRTLLTRGSQRSLIQLTTGSQTRANSTHQREPHRGDSTHSTHQRASLAQDDEIYLSVDMRLGLSVTMLKFPSYIRSQLYSLGFKHSSLLRYSPGFSV